MGGPFLWHAIKSTNHQPTLPLAAIPLSALEPTVTIVTGAPPPVSDLGAITTHVQSRR